MYREEFHMGYPTILRLSECLFQSMAIYNVVVNTYRLA